MKREIRLELNATLLSTNEAALRKITMLLSELEEKGLLKDGRIIFDSEQEDEVNEIFDRYTNLVPNAKN